MDYAAFIRERRAEILERIADAAKASGRSADAVTLVAVSKTVGIEEVADAYAAGYAVFAENRPQELKRKQQAALAYPELASVRWDMIGHLQTNKVKDVVGAVELIHSVDSLRLAEAIERRAERLGITVPILMEVNVAGEESKSGFSPEDARLHAEQVIELAHVSLKGLMCMAPAHDAAAARRAFSDLRELRDLLARDTGCQLDELSCGMSDDYALAIEEGSTMIRLGRTVFDPAYALQ